jgi:hypothetical protein
MLRLGKRLMMAALTCGVLLGVTAIPAGAAAPSIAITPTTGISGQTFVVSGGGWRPYDSSISVSLTASGTTICTVTSDSTGIIGPTGCPVPTTVPAGSYAYGANDGTVSVGAPKPVTILPGVKLSNPYPYGSGTNEVSGNESVTVSGSGFAASSPISATFNGSPVTFSAKTTTSPQGVLSAAAFKTPALRAGTANLVVKDGAGHSATARLFDFAPKLTIAPTTAISGRVISLAGSGWPVNASLTVYLTNGTAYPISFCTVTTDETGAMPAQACTMPTSAPAATGYQLTLSDTGSRAMYGLNASFPVKFAPGIFAVNTVTNNHVAAVGAGQVVSVIGSGFKAGSAVSATFNSRSVTLSPAANATTNTYGAFGGFGTAAATFTVPATTGAGPGTLVVKDAAGNSATLKLSVVRATIKTSAPTTGKPPSTVLVPTINGFTPSVAVSGTGWYPLDSVALYLYTLSGSYEAQLTTIYADANGLISGQPVGVSPYVPGGKYELVATDGQVAVSIPVTLVPTLQVTTTANTPASAASPGTTLNLAGYGFAASSKIASVTLGSTSVKVTTTSPPLTTNSGGYFSYGTTIVVPSVARGTYALKVKDAAGDTASVNLTVD